ncbi:MAG: T9SS type A sorting domain-containing protein [Algibacter sp.]
MKKLFCLSAFALCLGLTSSLNAQTESHDFNDGLWGPFKVGKTEQENRVKVLNQRVKTTWDEDDYNGTNSGRKSQFNLTNNVTWTQEFWTGFMLNVDSNYMANNTNTEAALMQIWGINSSGSGNHMAMLKFDGNNGGELTWQHRYNSVAAEQDYLVDDNFTRNTYKKIIIRIKLAEYNKGIVQIWVDDVLKLDKSNQTIGWGTQTSNGQTGGAYCLGPSFGQYNFLVNASTAQTYYSSSHSFDGHMNGEERTVSYDDVSVYVGSNGYDIVDPDGGSTSSGGDFKLVKRNSTGFAINGGGTNSGLNGRSVKLYTNITHNNLTWTEISRGGGYYSYEKLNSGYCMDGGSGGANAQNVTMQVCDASDNDQQWEKIDAGNGHYRLQKRGTNFSLDGGNGGLSNQNVYLWTSSSTNQNQQWRFDDVSTAKKSELKIDTEQLEDNLDALSVFPNPVENNLNIKLSGNYDQETAIALYAINGQKVIETKPNKEEKEVNLDLSKLNSGIYILKVNSKTQNLTKKIIKL